ncbi:MAG: hypothetical protein ACU84H_09370 [Gammaproteobacteria bacterium]
MVINLALFLYFSALSFFLSAQLSVWAALPSVAGQLFKLGALLILSAFALLFISGLILFVKLALASVFTYFLPSHRIKRNYLFVKNSQDQIDRLIHFRIQKITHFRDLTIKRLIVANDRKHLHSLSSAIRKDLQAKKKKLPSKIYKKMRWECLYFRIQKDDQSLLKLQQRITELV